MIRLTLVTVSIIDAGCFSVLLDEDDVPLIVTLERTFEDGPIVPGGVYLCKRRMFHRGDYMTHEITGVAGHGDILIHRGNVETNSEGCVLTGSKFGRIDGKPAVLESGVAFGRYWALMGNEAEYELEVTGR